MSLKVFSLLENNSNFLRSSKQVRSTLENSIAIDSVEFLSGFVSLVYQAQASRPSDPKTRAHLGMKLFGFPSHWWFYARDKTALDCMKLWAETEINKVRLLGDEACWKVLCWNNFSEIAGSSVMQKIPFCRHKKWKTLSEQRISWRQLSENAFYWSDTKSISCAASLVCWFSSLMPILKNMILWPFNDWQSNDWVEKKLIEEAITLKSFNWSTLIHRKQWSHVERLSKFEVVCCEILRFFKFHPFTCNATDVEDVAVDQQVNFPGRIGDVMMILNVFVVVLEFSVRVFDWVH